MPKAGAVEVRAVEFNVHEVPLPRLLIALPGPAAIRIPVPIGPGRSAGDVVRREGVGVRGEHRAHLRTRRRFEILSATSRPSSTSGASAPSRSGRRSPTISRNARRTSPSCEQIRLGMPTRMTTRCSTAHRDVAELRTLGCLPGARGGTEAGVRKASREETAWGVRTGGGVRLWRFSPEFSKG